MDGRGWNTNGQPPAGNQYQNSGRYPNQYGNGYYQTGGQAPMNGQNPGYYQQTGAHQTGGYAADGNPFGDTGVAPELKEGRSEELMEKNSPFWAEVKEDPMHQPVHRGASGHRPREMEMREDRLLKHDSQPPMEEIRRFLGSGALKKLLLVIAVIGAVAFLLYSAFFQVRSIQVVGNQTVSAQEIIRLSGLKAGQSSLTIDDEQVMRRVESNRYLRCTLVDVQLDTVLIHVKERVPAAYLNHNGMIIMMDNRGFVLEESLTAYDSYSSLVKVVGMDVRRSAAGQKISLESARQMEVYTQVLVELKAMQGLSNLAELDMSGMDSIYLATRDGFSVRLGSDESIHEKLRAFLITRERLLEMDKYAGTIDVTDPGRPTYSPPAWE